MFEAVNGYSNMYWGWGGEDDDMKFRLEKFGGYKILHPDIKLGRYKMIRHTHDPKHGGFSDEDGNNINQKRHELVNTAQSRWMHDGLNSLNNFQVISRVQFGVFERILVDIGDPPKKV